MVSRLRDSWKKRAASKALELEEWFDSQIIGLGTGSTVSYLIEMLSSEHVRGKRFVASSWDTALKLKSKGAVVLDTKTLDIIDLYVDSADAFDDDGNLIKGGGAAFLHEKILAGMADSFVVIVDESKRVEDLRSRRVPVLVAPSALSFVERRLGELYLNPVLRVSGSGKWGPVSTEEGCAIIDIDLASWKGGLEELDILLKRVPGILETGLFIGMADILIVGGEETYIKRIKS